MIQYSSDSHLAGKNKSQLFCILLVMALFVSLQILSAVAEEPQNDRQFSANGAGAVSCGHPLAAAAAMQILNNGGNAVDAAVAAGFMLGVVDFTNSGIGGDGFALIRTPEGRVTAFDGSTRRPGLKKTPDSRNFIGLPTVPELLLKLLRLYGRKPASEVMAPAVFTCIKGFKITAYLEKVIEKKLLSAKDPQLISFLAPTGYPLRAGQIFRQPRLAGTLLRLSADGGHSFYRGDDAMRTVADMQKRGSLYQLEDFARYRSLPVSPLRYDYHGFSIYGTPPPSCSIASIKLALDFLKLDSSLFPGNAEEMLSLARTGQRVISAKYKGLAGCHSDPYSFFAIADRGDEPAASADVSIPDTNTTHLCVWDKDGMIVSMTLTLGNHFGTGELAPGGFFYNNGLRNYSSEVAAYPENYPENAGPVSAKSPLIVCRDGKPWLAIGGAGADRIIFNTAMTLARVLSGHELEKSIAAPRFYLDYRNRLTLEWQPNVSILEEAGRLNENFELKPGCDDFFGLVSAIQKKNDGSLVTAADQRRDGSCRAGN